MKRWHDLKIFKSELTVVDPVMLYNSGLRLFLGKIKSKWLGPFKVSKALGNSVIEVKNENGEKFKVNG